MSELTPEARRMLMAARAAAEPTEADRARVLGLVTGAIAATTTSTAAASVASAKSTSLVSSALFLKVGAAVILSFGGGYALHAYTTAPSSNTATSTPHVAPIQAPQLAVPIQAPEPIAAPPHAEREAPTATTIPAARARNTTKRHTVAHAAHVAEEVASIGRAEAALERQDPRGALRALKEHAQQFPQGELQQERLGLRAIALCSLHDATARRESARFLEHHQSSVLAPRVRSACEGL